MVSEATSYLSLLPRKGLSYRRVALPCKKSLMKNKYQ
nr:MAG TPA: hypothetical protein [Caudoviricetes sp.]